MPETEAQIACPHCGASNRPAQGNAPFFCIGCKAIVDPINAIQRGSAPSASSAPPAPSTHRPPEAQEPPPSGSGHSTGSVSGPAESYAASSSSPSYVSRYSTSEPLHVAGPASGPSVAGSALVGLLLAALAGGVLGVGLGWFGASVLFIPIVFPLLAGWAIKRALALGSGGGTPDRGPLVGGVLLAVVIGSFLLTRYAEYRVVAGKAASRFQDAFGVGAAQALESPEATISTLKARDDEHDGIVRLASGDIDVGEALDQLRNAKAAGRPPREPYDVELLAANGGVGFIGHLRHAVADGQSLRLFAKAPGVRLPGFAILVLWIVELGLLLMASFAKVE